MYVKGTTLFDPNQLLDRPLPDQLLFEDSNEDFLSAFYQMVEREFQTMTIAREKKRPKSVNRNWAANEMNGNLIAGISEEFPDFIQPVRGSYQVVLNGIECYVKKLNDKYLPQYNHSSTSERIVNGQATLDEDLRSIIFLGYRATKKMTDIKGIYAVCVKAEELLWVSDLSKIHNRLKERVAANSATASARPNLEVGIKAPRRKAE